MSATVRDRLRLGYPVRGSFDGKRLYSAPPSPHCPNTGERPAWLLDKWHCGQDHELDQRYGIRCEDYWRLFELQDGRCALCGSPPRRYRLVVHHDHRLGAVVALLHFPCNRVVDPLLWLLPRLVALMTDPPGRSLGLVVPQRKRERLEAATRRKTERKERKERPVVVAGDGAGSHLERLRQMSKGGSP